MKINVFALLALWLFSAATAWAEGFANPNSIVDVLVTETAAGKTITRVVAERMRVVRIANPSGPEPRPPVLSLATGTVDIDLGAGRRGGIVTLAGEQEGLQNVSDAGAHGTLTLVLRAPDVESPPIPPPASPAPARSKVKVGAVEYRLENGKLLELAPVKRSEAQPR